MKPRHGLSDLPLAVILANLCHSLDLDGAVGERHSPT